MKFAIPTVYNNNILYCTYNMSRIWRREDDRQSFDVDGLCLNFLRESSPHRTRNHPPTSPTRFYRVFNNTAASTHDEGWWWWTHTHVYNAYYTVLMIYDFPATFVYEMFMPLLSVYVCVCVGALYIFNSHLSACLSPSPPLLTYTHRRRSNIFDDYAPFSLSTLHGFGAEGDWRRRRRFYILIIIIIWNTYTDTQSDSRPAAPMPFSRSTRAWQIDFRNNIIISDVRRSTLISRYWCYYILAYRAVYTILQ